MGVSHPPITLEGYFGCRLYLALLKVGQSPDPSLLLYGLPQGGILDAEVRYDPVDGSAMIAVTFRDQQEPGRVRSPRLYDPEGFLLLRLLMLAATLLRIDRTEKNSAENPRKEGHRINILDDIALYRVIAGVKPSQTVEQRDHLSSRRRDLFIIESASAAHQGFEKAVERALDAFDRYPPTHLPISRREDYEALLRDVFALVEKISLERRTP